MEEENAGASVSEMLSRVQTAVPGRRIKPKGLEKAYQRECVFVSVNFGW